MKRLLLTFAALAAFWATSVAFALIWVQPSRFSSAGAGASPPEDDDFSGATQDPLAGRYIVIRGAVKRESGEAVLASGSDATVRVDPAQYSYNSNQLSETVLTGAENASNPLVRVQADGSAYEAQVVSSFGGVALIYKRVWNGSAYDYTEIDRAAGVFPSADLGIRASGSSIILYQGVYGSGHADKLTVTDSTYTGGTPGFRLTTGGGITSRKGNNL